MTRKKKVEVEAPATRELLEAEPVIEIVSVATKKNQLLTILDSAPSRPCLISNKIDPEREMTLQFDANYADFVRRLKEFAECL